MPTGYTAEIAEGITFKKFAMQCARAFGACIEMRDDPMDKPIPDEFKPSSYHTDELRKAHELLKQVQGMTAAECEEAAVRDSEKAIREYKRAIAKNEALRVKYDAMLDKVRAWKSPSSDHDKFKDFMSSQILDSIAHDCDGTYYHDQLKKHKVMSGKDWRAEQLERHKHDIAYHTEENRKEVETAKGRTLWVKQLRDSLKSSP